jgi:predicted nucleic acid-binding protein
VKLVFDTSVWVEHLRRDALSSMLPRLRGRYQLWMDALVAAELIAGCRSRREHRIVDSLLSPFRRANRVRSPIASEIADAGRALSALRARGTPPSNAMGALIDAMIAVGAARSGALFVSENARDFSKLASVLPLRWETYAAFSARV